MSEEVKKEEKINGTQQEALAYNVEDLTEEEFSNLIDFINRPDVEELQSIFIFSRNKDFSEAEITVLFDNELFVRTKSNNNTTIHNERLAMDSKFEYEWDSAISIRKRDIIAVGVNRPALCECPQCAEKREKGERPEQPSYYELEIFSATKTISARIYDKGDAFMTQYMIKDWMFGDGAFSPNANKKSKKKK